MIRGAIESKSHATRIHVDARRTEASDLDARSCSLVSFNAAEPLPGARSGATER